MSKEILRFSSQVPAAPAENSLQAKIRSKLAPKFGSGPGPDNFALLLDTTGSMWGDKIRKLRESVRAFPKVRKFQYADDISELKEGQECREPAGENNEPRAFTHLKSLGIKNIVMITDGYPNYPAASLEAAKGLHIDIIYIGPPPPPPFLEQLAKQCGGSFDPHVEFDKMYGAKALEAKIKGLLPAPAEEKGVIRL